MHHLLHFAANFAVFLVLFLVLVVAIFVYILPACIATIRGHNHRYAIAVLNILCGWTVLGWFALLFWSALGRPENEPNVFPVHF